MTTFLYSRWDESHAVEDGTILPDGDTTTILVVDDDPGIRLMLRGLCDVEGFEVIGEASDGLEGAGLALEKQPTVVILDYKMPKLDGERTAALLRSVAPNSKIVVFSGVLQHAPDWADDYVDKERISELIPRLGRLLQSR